MQLNAVLLSDGSSLAADMVVVGAGARPASSLFKGQLDMDKDGGIVVDGNFKVRLQL
jgi:monodehydroascorbate reductase (NADH)